MKNSMRIFFIALVAGGSFSALQLVTKGMGMDNIFKSVYGPVQEQEATGYIFDYLHRPYHSSLPYKRIQELSKEEFKNVIVASFDSKIQNKVSMYVDTALKTSEEYQLDPFWLISVMMVESTFNANAQSPRDAIGLMQVMPATAEDVFKMMRVTLSKEEINERLFDPEANIDIGAFYLKKLLLNFRLNYKKATVAYNVGPARLRGLIKKNAIVLDDTTYLQRVDLHYGKMNSSLKNYLRHKSPAIRATLESSLAYVKPE